MLQITASMDREREAARVDGGRKIEVSEIELLALCTMAKYGLYRAFGDLGAGNAYGCRRRAVEILEAIKELDVPHQPGKTPRLIQTCAAMLGGERLGKYVMEY